MSFILDALRKSETDRQRQSGPGLVDAGYRPPAQRRSWWMPVLVVVLAANLVAMAVFWLRREPAAVLAPAPAPIAVPTEPEPAGRSLAAAAGVDTPVEDAYGAVADLPALEAEPVTEVLPVPTDAIVLKEDGTPSAIRKDLPTAEELASSGSIPSGDLHLDIHVYNEVAAERFVFIDMRKYGEGAELPQGARIEEITRDGVVLSQNGQRFTLTRD